MNIGISLAVTAGRGGGGGDVAVPTVSSAVIDAAGTSFTITFNEAVTGHDGLTITPSGGAATLTYSSGEGTAALVFTISRTIGVGETATRTYVPGDIEDLAGNDLAAFAGAAVTNNSTADVTVPTLSSPTVPAAGTTLTATLSEAGCLPASGTGGFTLAGTDATVSSWAISGTTLTLTLAGTVIDGETVTYSYARASTSDDIHDAANNFLVDFAGEAVTNDSTQADLSEAPLPWFLGLDGSSHLGLLDDADRPGAMLLRQMENMFGRGVIAVYDDNGFPGRQTSQMDEVADIAALTDQFDLDGTNVVVLCEGINDRVGDPIHPLATCISNATSLGSTYRTAQGRVLWLTSIGSNWDQADGPNDGVGIFADWKTTERHTFDAAMVAAEGTSFDDVLYWYDDPTYGPLLASDTATTDHPELFRPVAIGDGNFNTTHFTPAGQEVFVRAILPRVATLFGRTFTATQASLRDKLKSFWPLWKVGAETSPNNPTTDYHGQELLTPNVGAGALDQNDRSVTFTRAASHPYFSRAFAAHDLHARAAGFAFGMWFKPAALNIDLHFGGVDNGGLSVREYGLFWFNADQKYSVYGYAADDSYIQALSAVSGLTAGVWHLLVLRYNGTQIGISVNGEATVWQTIAIRTNGASDFLIGGGVYDGQHLNGEVRGAFFTKEDVTTAEIAYLWNSGTPRDQLFDAPV